MQPQYSPLHGAPAPMQTTGAYPSASGGYVPTTGSYAPSTYVVGAPVVGAPVRAGRYRPVCLALAIALMVLALLCFLVACATPGWVYDDDGDFYPGQFVNNGTVPIDDDSPNYYGGLWHECYKNTPTSSVDCHHLKAKTTGSNSISHTMAAARAFTILQCVFALITIIIMAIVMSRVTLGHYSGMGTGPGWGVFTFLIAIVAFVISMWAMEFFHDSNTWDNIGWCWGTQVAGLVLTLLAIIMYSVGLPPRVTSTVV